MSEINQPTRDDGCLDHLMVKSVHKNINHQISVNTEVLEHNITDHAAILFTIDHKLALGDAGSLDSASYKIIDQKKLKSQLRITDWNSLLTSTADDENINNKYERVIARIQQCQAAATKNNKYQSYTAEG